MNCSYKVTEGCAVHIYNNYKNEMKAAQRNELQVI